MTGTSSVRETGRDGRQWGWTWEASFVRVPRAQSSTRYAHYGLARTYGAVTASLPLSLASGHQHEQELDKRPREMQHGQYPSSTSCHCCVGCWVEAVDSELHRRRINQRRGRDIWPVSPFMWHEKMIPCPQLSVVNSHFSNSTAVCTE